MLAKRWTDSWSLIKTLVKIRVCWTKSQILGQKEVRLSILGGYWERILRSWEVWMFVHRCKRGDGEWYARYSFSWKWKTTVTFLLLQIMAKILRVFFLRCFCPNGIRGSKSVSQKISDSCSRLKPWSKFGFVQLKIKFWFKKNTFVPGFVVPVWIPSASECLLAAILHLFSLPSRLLFSGS